MSYEKGTVVHQSLALFLENIPDSELDFPASISSIDKRGDEMQTLFQDGVTSLPNPLVNANIIDDYKKDGISITNLIENVDYFSKVFRTNFDENSYYSYYSYWQYVIISAEVTDNLKYLGLSHSFYHKKLNAEIDVVKFSSKFMGKDIVVEMAYSYLEGDLPWIENIYFADATISTWGFLREQINAGILFSKPIEYTNQCPLFIQEKGKRIGKYMVK